MAARPLVIVTGYNIRYPLSGQVTHNLNYLVGLSRLGCEVWYVEESGSWPYSCFNPATGEMTSDPSEGLRLLQQTLAPHGLDRNWLFVDEQRCYHNRTAAETLDLCRRADALLNISFVTWLPEFAECKRRIYVDTDPGVTQFQMSAERTPSMSGFASPYDHHFHYTVGLNVGAPDCTVPTWGLQWRPWFQPIVLDLFPYTYTPEAKMFTTVMSWAARKPMVYDGVEYGFKSQEFLRFLDLPQRAGKQFEIAMSGVGTHRDEVLRHGWQLRLPSDVTRDCQTYRDFIARSRGEFSVASNIYVKTRGGWFSDRSAVYLAMGKPLVIQDTNARCRLPAGEGFLTFQTMDEILAALEEVNGNYERHCKTARRLAEEYFDSSKLLSRMLDEVGV
jgi:hypothetical protein